MASTHDEVDEIVTSSTGVVEEKFAAAMTYTADMYKVVTDILEQLQSALLDTKTQNADVEIDDVSNPPTFDELKQEVPDMEALENKLEDIIDTIAETDRPNDPAYVPVTPVTQISAEDIADPKEPPTLTILPFTDRLNDANLNFDYDMKKLSWSEDPYTSTLFTNLQNWYNNVITTGGTAMPQSVQDAEYARDVVRATQAKADSINSVIQVWSKRGFDLPTGDIEKKVLSTELEWMNARLDKSNAILVEVWKLEQANIHKAIEVGTAFEAKAMDYVNSMRNRALQTLIENLNIAIKIITVELAKLEYRFKEFQIKYQVWDADNKVELEKMQGYLGEMEGYKAKLSGLLMKYNVLIENMKAGITYNEEQLREFLGYVEMYKVDVGIGVTKAEIGMKAMTVEAATFDSIAKAYEVLGSLDAKVYDANVQKAIAEAQVKLRNAEIEIGNYERTKTMILGTLSEIGKLAAQIMASSLTSVSAQASIAADGRASLDYQYSENHNYDDTTI